MSAAPAAPCPNCGSSAVRRYCPECGQAAPTQRDYSLRAYTADAFEQLASVDGKAIRTVWTLVSAPGVLTAEHLAGRRSRYLRPLQLFLLVNVVLFVAAPKMPLFNYNLATYSQSAPPSPVMVRSLVARAARDHPSGSAEYSRAFDGRVESQRKSLILLFAPAIALLLRLLFLRAKSTGVPHRYGEHLVFALHTLAFVWLVFVGWGAVAGALVGTTLTGAPAVLVIGCLTTLLLAMPGYVYLGIRRVYMLSVARAIVLTALLSAAFVGLLVAYRALLFFTTFYSIR